MTPRPDQAQRDALMARRKKKPKSRRQELLEELIAEAGPEALKDPEGLLKELTKRLVERALEGEMTGHLGYERHAPEGQNSGNLYRTPRSWTTTPPVPDSSAIL